jgi:hypothetical protein
MEYETIAWASLEVSKDEEKEVTEIAIERKRFSTAKSINCQ